MWQPLKLLNYLRKMNLSLAETAALIRRLETNSCRPEDDESPRRLSQPAALSGFSPDH